MRTLTEEGVWRVRKGFLEKMQFSRRINRGKRFRAREEEVPGPEAGAGMLKASAWYKASGKRVTFRMGSGSGI